VNPKVIAEVQRAVDAANAKVSRAESIRKFQILATDLTEASGHLTPKMSIKRNIIVEDFADVIDGIYNATPASTEGVAIG
jgi:long-chain acyl-CoA synthetase